MNINLLQIIDLFASELNLNRANILPNAPKVLPHTLSTGVHLLRVHPIFRVQILNLTIREHPIKLILDLVLRPKLALKSQALLFTSQFQQVRTLSHDGCTTCWHLEDLFLG